MLGRPFFIRAAPVHLAKFLLWALQTTARKEKQVKLCGPDPSHAGQTGLRQKLRDASAKVTKFSWALRPKSKFCRFNFRGSSF